MTGLIIFAAAIALFFLLGYLSLQIAVLRTPLPDFSDPNFLRKTKWSVLEGVITESCAWLKEQKKEDWYVISHDGKRLHGIFVPRENARGTLVFFHGYRSSHVMDFSASMRFYHELGLNLLICDQRAHGKSQGKCITYGAKERFDVVSWTTYLAMMLGEDHPVFLAGLSMGATTVLLASELEHDANIRAILTDCGFTSPEAIISHVAKQDMHLPPKIVVPFLNLFTTVFAGFRLDCCNTVTAMENAKYPVFFVHGKDDDFVPCSMTEENFAACQTDKDMLLVEGAGHGMSFLVQPEEYKKRLTAFIEKHI